MQPLTVPQLTGIGPGAEQEQQGQEQLGLAHLPLLGAAARLCGSLSVPVPKGWLYTLGPAVPSSQETMWDGLIVLIRAVQ